MNLADLLDLETGLQEDEHLGETFGEGQQVRIIGWSGWYRNSHRLYIVHYAECCKDAELFGEGYFTTRYSNLSTNKSLPCGCGVQRNWTSAQYATLLGRKAKELGYEFIGFVGDKVDSKCKIKVECETHGIWESSVIANFLQGRANCPNCLRDLIKSGIRRLSDEEMTEMFVGHGSYPEGTEFWRSDRLNTQNCTPYWFLKCSGCGDTCEVHHTHIKMGRLSCSCRGFRKSDRSYIFLISDNGLPVAIKFGISSNVKERLYKIRQGTKLTVEFFGCWRYDNHIACQIAERHCKEFLDCGVLQEQEFRDGYTETTWVYNLDEIVNIYENNNGTREDVKFRKYTKR